MNIKTVRRKSQPEFEELMRRTGGRYMPDGAFRAMLDSIHEKCYVEAEFTRQGGDVCGIIRDRYGVPVAVKVKYEEFCDERDAKVRGYDYIAMADITFWEPWDHYTPAEDFEDMSGYEEALLADGYVWDPDRDGGCFYNAETGDEVVW